MTIPEMQEYSLVYSENTPAYALAERLGGMEKFYGMLDKYGKSKGEVKTIQMHGNKTTTDYYIQVLDYLWKHQEDYKDILKYLGESFPEYYYKTYNQGLTIYRAYHRIFPYHQGVLPKRRLVYSLSKLENIPASLE